MLRKGLFEIALILLLMHSVSSASNIKLAISEPRILVVPYEYTNIQEAIDNARDGDTVYVRAGTYYECVTIKKKISLIGENKYHTIIDGRFNNKSIGVISVEANHVLIANFTIRGAGLPESNMPRSVIFMAGNFNVISNNKIYDGQIGISIWGKSEYNKIVDNLIECDMGIGLFASDRTSIYGNSVHGSIHCWLSSGNKIYNNVICGTLDIYMYSDKNYVYNNTIRGSGVGISIRDWSYENVIYENNFHNKELAIYIVHSSLNRIFHNNFLGNAQNVKCDNQSANQWDNGYPSGGNYWSDYLSVDVFRGPYQNETGNDGFWDHPYVINDRNVDMYPLTTQFTGHLEISIVHPSPDDLTKINLKTPLTFRVKVTFKGQPIRDAHVNFYCSRNIGIWSETMMIGNTTLLTDEEGYAEIKNWYPPWNETITFEWWAEAWKSGYEKCSSEKRRIQLTLKPNLIYLELWKIVILVITLIVISALTFSIMSRRKDKQGINAFKEELTL